MRKILTILLFLCISLCACGKAEIISYSVFETNYKDLDFSKEVFLNEAYYSEDENIECDTGANYEKLRRWGIKRGKDHMPASADIGVKELLEKYDGIFLADTSKKTIYLTFDEGYENGNTSRILDILKENNVNAIFFITGPYLNKEEDLVRRMVEEGHVVGNHTVHHPSLPTLKDEEIEKEIIDLDALFYEKFGRNMIYLRPPKGEYSERTLDLTNRMGYINVFWSFAYDDWFTNKQRGWEYAYKKIMDNTHNGEIILLHAVSNDNTEALDKVIKDTINEGYCFGDVNELQKIAKGDN